MQGGGGWEGGGGGGHCTAREGGGAVIGGALRGGGGAVWGTWTIHYIFLEELLRYLLLPGDLEGGRCG